MRRYLEKKIKKKNEKNLTKNKSKQRACVEELQSPLSLEQET